jgi:single-strand DNA-binding protein
MKVEIIGTLKEVQEIMTFDSGFQKRTVVIETEDKYDNVIPVQLLKDNVTALDGVEVGTRVKLAVYLGGREWNGKYFVDLKYAELLGVQRDLNKEPAPAPQPENRAKPPSKPAKQTHMEVDTGEDLPF